MTRWLLLLFAAPLLAQDCTYLITPGSVSLPATGLAELSPQFNVSTRLGCAWTARSNVPWIRISFGQSGNGNGTVGITADINREAVARSGSLTIAGQTISIQQAAANCTFLLNPSSATASPAGGTSIFQVNTTCAWQVVTNVDWIDVTSPSGGAGLGTNVVTYVVQANGGASRTGTITVGPVRFTVNQPAGACTQTLNPMQVDLPATGGNGTVQVTSNCTWTAVSNDAWITITGGASANRDGTLSYSVQANPLAPSRSGTIRIGNQTFTVNQAGVGCTVTLTPSSVNVPSNGVAGTVNVSATCVWTAVSNDPWITITTAPGTVAYVVAANINGPSRAGSISIGNQSFSITQEAGGCKVILSPASVQVTAAGGGGSVLVSGPPSCQWIVTTMADWITLPIERGEGSGSMIYTVASNPGSARTATISVNSEIFTISQAGVPPIFTTEGVLNAASFAGGSVAPGLIVTIFGKGLGPSTLTVAVVTPPARTFPTELATTRVLFDGVPAPLIYVSATQVSAVTPFGVVARSATLMEVEVDGKRSPPVFMPVDPVAPGIFTQSAQGFGPGAILNQDSTVNGPSNPAAAGSVVVLFGTGGGAVVPPIEDGRLADGASLTIARVTAEVDGQPAEVLYAGAAPDLIAGVLQVNIRLPANLGSGDLPVIIRAGETASQARVSVSLR